jgi:integrase
MANPRKLPSGRWQARFPAPDRHRETFATKKEADLALFKARTALNEGIYLSPRLIPTFREVADEWIAGKSGKRPGTVAAWQTHLDLHLLPIIGAARLDRITVGMIEKQVRDVLRKKPLSTKTVNKVLTTCNAVFKLAVRRGYCVANPITAAERLGAESHELFEGITLREESGSGVQPDDVLSAPEINRLLAATSTGLYRTLVLTAAMTGARDGELFALRWSDIDFETMRIFIRRSLSWARLRTPEDNTPARPRFYEPKTETGRRSIPMAHPLAAALRVWKVQCPPSELDLVFCRLDGKPLHRSNVLRQGMYPALRRAKLRRVRGLHSLRHSFASILIEEGRPITEIQRLLGHKSPETTLRVYSHWFRHVRTNSVDSLANAIFGGGGHLVDTLGDMLPDFAVNDDRNPFISKDNMAPPGRFELPAPGLGTPR